MQFFPVVQRELAVAARRKATNWGRVASGGITFGVFVSLLIAQKNSPARVGTMLLQFLTLFIFLECLIAGPRYTADAISEEKREGTRGLLFLTDLMGIDVVLGKMISRSIGSVYNLIATIPIFGLSLMLGGITGRQILQTSLVLVVTTLLSLSIGLVVSSRGFGERNVVVGSMFWVAVVTLAPPCLWKMLSLTVGPTPPIEFILSFSPAYAYKHASGGMGAGVVLSCWTMLIVSLFMVGYAAWKTQANAHQSEAPAKEASPLTVEQDVRKKFHTFGLEAARRSLLHQNPMLWLITRGKFTRREPIILAFVSVGFGIFSMICLGQNWHWLVPVVVFGSYGLHAAYKFFVTAESCRVLNDAKRSGALELLLSTPLPPSFIVRGQVRATRKIWIWPAIALALMNCLWMTDHDFLRDVGIVLPCSLFLLVADSYALCWRGVLNSLKGERFPKTVFKTFLQVVGPPIFAMSLAVFVTISGGISSTTANSIYALWTLVSTIYDIGLISAAKLRLARFRALAAGDGYGPKPPSSKELRHHPIEIPEFEDWSAQNVS
jgi:hypothetical protein